MRYHPDHAYLKASLDGLVDRTGRVEDILAILAEIYRERAKHPDYAYPLLRDRMRATAHVLFEASEAVTRIFSEDQDEALERAAGRAAYQEAHEAGRRNPSAADYEAIERAVLRAANQNRRNPDGGGLDADKAFAALDHFEKVRELLYAHRDQFGTRRGVRLDIPSAKHRGIVVVSVHEGPSGGEVIGYDRSAVVDDARFIVQAGGQKKIGAEGSNKFPMSYVGGTIVDEEATPAGVPVYYDPRHVHLYVDARNGLPLKGAGRVNFSAQRGEGYFIPEIRTIYIWAEDPVYYAPGEAPPPPEGMESAVVMPRSNPEEFFVVNETDRTSLSARAATRGPRWKWEAPLFNAVVFDSEEDALAALATIPKTERRKWKAVHREELEALIESD
jgi:hypothetical protein